jgi:hypothetical protein
MEPDHPSDGATDACTNTTESTHVDRAREAAEVVLAQGRGDCSPDVLRAERAHPLGDRIARRLTTQFSSED